MSFPSSAVSHRVREKKLFPNRLTPLCSRNYAAKENVQRRHARRPWLFLARRMGTARGDVARLAAQRPRLAGQVRTSFRGFTARWRGKFPPARKSGSSSGTNGTKTFARRVFKAVGVDLRKIPFVTHPTNRGWTRDTGPIFVRKRPAQSRLKPPLSISISTAGPNTTTGARTLRCPKPPRAVLGKKLFHAECDGQTVRHRRRRH